MNYKHNTKETPLA